MINFNEKQWQYEITPLSVNVIQDNGEQFVVADRLYQMTFLDVTGMDQTFQSLLITLLVVGFVLLVIFFFFVLFFEISEVNLIVKRWENRQKLITVPLNNLK